MRLKRTLSAVLTLIASGPTYAAEFQDQRGDWWTMPVPPARYSAPYTGQLEVFPMSEAETAEICSEATGKAEQFGCSFVFTDRCDVYISEDLPPIFRQAVERHEIAHCNGWGENHPQD